MMDPSINSKMDEEIKEQMIEQNNSSVEIIPRRTWAGPKMEEEDIDKKVSVLSKMQSMRNNFSKKLTVSYKEGS
jgi:hypothetical protein